MRRGDSRVADELYRRLSGVVDRTLYKIFGRRESDHDDIVQMAFEQVVETLSRQQFAGACSLETWASRVASHVGLNALLVRDDANAALGRSSARTRAFVASGAPSRCSRTRTEFWKRARSSNRFDDIWWA